MCRKTAVFPSSFSQINIVISGFNTDVNYEDVVYHIQTEDKGLKSRLIVSLVYNGGTILASKRASYEDLANGSFDENELAERVQRQHKLICAAVKAGRINELKGMAASDRRAAAESKEGPVAIIVDSPALIPLANPPQFRVAVARVPHIVMHEEPNAEPAPRVMPVPDIELKIIDDGPIFESVSVIEDEAILAPEAVAVVSELSGNQRPAHTKLSVELLGDTRFKGGDRRTVTIMVCRGTGRRVIADAQIMVKVLGSSFRPVIFHAISDANGLARVHLQLPNFQAGRAAILIRAMSGGEEIELRRIITPG